MYFNDFLIFIPPNLMIPFRRTEALSAGGNQKNAREQPFTAIPRLYGTERAHQNGVKTDKKSRRRATRRMPADVNAPGTADGVRFAHDRMEKFSREMFKRRVPARRRRFPAGRIPSARPRFGEKAVFLRRRRRGRRFRGFSTEPARARREGTLASDGAGGSERAAAQKNHRRGAEKTTLPVTAREP